jgi:hypothetical protein
MVIRKIKVALAVATIFTAQIGVVLAQDTPVEEVKEEKEKKEKKEKVKKDDGKLHKADKKTEILKYRRSSLHTMIIEDTKLPKSDLILNTFNEAPFPDKYNNHTIADKSFKLGDYYVAPVAAEGEKVSKKEKKDLTATVEKFLKEKKIANQIVAKWFNRTPEGAFDMNLISERGAYDASSQDAAKAASTQRGLDMLKDAGIELLGSTFVVVNYSNFVSNEAAAKVIYDAAMANIKGSGALAEAAQKLAKKKYEQARQGYTVWTTAYLCQLNWSDSVEAFFWNDYWMDASNIDPAKKEKFDNTDFFSMKILGHQKASALVTGMNKDDAGDTDKIIAKATLKTVNSVYNKLAKKFEPFRTKTPLVSVEPLGAKIGMKEELEGGDKYEVLMPSYDAEGKLKYKRKGILKVDKSKIWDNRFNAGEAPLDENGEPMKPENDLEFTHFKGKKGGLYPGLLLRQIN